MLKLDVSEISDVRRILEIHFPQGKELDELSDYEITKFVDELLYFLKAAK